MDNEDNDDMENEEDIRDSQDYVVDDMHEEPIVEIQLDRVKKSHS